VQAGGRCESNCLHLQSLYGGPRLCSAILLDSSDDLAAEVLSATTERVKSQSTLVADYRVGIVIASDLAFRLSQISLFEEGVSPVAAGRRGSAFIS